MILKHFLKLKIFSPTDCDIALAQYTQFLEELKRENSHELRHFKKWETNLDGFYFKKLDIDIRQYNKFLFVHKIILTLSHDQAAVESGFSLSKSSLQVNIKEESIVVKKIVRDHLLANKIDLPSLGIPNKLIIACNTAHSRYKASLLKNYQSLSESFRKGKQRGF